MLLYRERHGIGEHMYISADALLGLETIHQRALSVLKRHRHIEHYYLLRSCIAKTDIFLPDYLFRTLLCNHAAVI
jgi:hypothetical protein